MEANDRYAAYDAAVAGDRICSAAYLEISRLKAPNSSRGPAKRALTMMIDDCASSATNGAIAMERASKVLNGDDRPSAVSSVREAMGWVQTASNVCIVRVAEAAQANGVDLSALPAS